MIKAGDLVMVTKPTVCCGVTKQLGLVFRVGKIEGPCNSWCIHCGREYFGGPFRLVAGSFVQIRN